MCIAVTAVPMVRALSCVLDDIAMTGASLPRDRCRIVLACPAKEKQSSTARVATSLDDRNFQILPALRPYRAQLFVVSEHHDRCSAGRSASDGRANAEPPPHLGRDSAVDPSSPTGMKEAKHFDVSGASRRRTLVPKHGDRRVSGFFDTPSVRAKMDEVPPSEPCLPSIGLVTQPR